MPEVTTCPDCAKNLRVPDELLGKKVRCPGCRGMFIARAGVGQPETPAARVPARSEAVASSRSAPVQERDERPARPRDRDEEEDRPRRRDRDEDDDRRPPDEEKGWRGVRAGLTMTLIGGWLELAWVGVLAIGVGLTLALGGGLVSSISSGGAQRDPTAVAGGFLGMAVGFFLFVAVLGLIGLASGVLRLVGWGLCMQVPSSRRGSARVLVIIAFSIACTYVVLNLAGAAIRGSINTAQGGGIGPELAALMMVSGSSGGGLGCFGGVLNWAAFILWLLALRAIAVQAGKDEVASRVLAFLVADIIFRVLAGVLLGVAIITVGIGIFSSVRSESFSGAGAGLIVAGLIVGLIVLAYVAMCAWYVLVVAQVRGAVDRKLARL